MAANTQSLSALLKRSSIDDHEEILKACDILQKQSKADPEVLLIKAVALLKLDRHEDALRVLDGGDVKLQQKARLFRAYALYKIGELDQAIEIAKTIVDSRAAKHIEAQATYRLENFSHAATLYEDLQGNEASVQNEENDLRINSGAIDAQLEWRKQGHLVRKRKIEREDLEAFETASNAACKSIAKNEYGQAEVLLKRAKDLCSSLDELSDQEKTVEILSICVQQLYVMSMLGKAEEAEKIALDIGLNDIPDLSTRQIAQNNKLASASSLSNPYLAHRIFESTTIVPNTDKLFRFQAERINQNRLILDLLSLKFASVIKSSSKLLSDQPPTTSPHLNIVSVLNAAAHAQNQLGKLGLKKILPLVEKRPNDIGLILTIVQLYVLTNNPGSATTILESLLKRLSESQTPIDQDVRFAPGLVATLVSLYTSQGRKSQIKTSLAKAASYWRHKSKFSVPLLEAAGIALLDSTSIDHQALATDIFSTLHKSDPTSRIATAGYVASRARTFPETILPEADTLTPISHLIAGIDVAALESAGVPQPSTSQPSVLTTRKRALNEHPKPTKKRVRRNRLPKDYDPAKTPDPERWLPLRDRTSYRPKGRKARQKTAALTQGGMVEKGGAEGTGPGVGGGGKGGGEGGVIKASGGPVGSAGGGKGKKKKGKK